jgi:hypothetical protein
MARGLNAIKGVIDQNKRENAGSFTLRLQIADGDTAYVLFLDPTEPEAILEHNFKQGKQFTPIRHRDENCVACHVAASGDKRVGRVGPKFCFSTYDLRWTKKLKDVKRSEEEGRDKYTYEDMDESEVTEKGKARGIHIRRGKRTWKASNQWALMVAATNTQAGKRCKSCLRGKITRTGYEKKDGTPFRAKGMEDEKVDALLQSGKIVEVIECTNCETPVRKSIFNSIVGITRAGEGTNTTYQFEVLADDLPEDVLELMEGKEAPEPYDWGAVEPIPTAEAQARTLGIRNPFGKSGGGKEAGSYDEDEDESSEEEDDDEYAEDPFADDEEEDVEERGTSRSGKRVAVKKGPTKKVVTKKKTFTVSKPVATKKKVTITKKAPVKMVFKKKAAGGGR